MAHEDGNVKTKKKGGKGEREQVKGMGQREEENEKEEEAVGFLGWECSAVQCAAFPYTVQRKRSAARASPVAGPSRRCAARASPVAGPSRCAPLSSSLATFARMRRRSGSPCFVCSFSRTGVPGSRRARWFPRLGLGRPCGSSLGLLGRRAGTTPGVLRLLSRRRWLP